MRRTGALALAVAFAVLAVAGASAQDFAINESYARLDALFARAAAG
ncbi:MAG: hypothetical protein ACYDA3_04645 [Gaiellaceae bacterium]